MSKKSIVIYAVESGFEQFKRKCFVLDEQWRDETTDAGYKLGFYNNEKRQIMLYCVLNTPTHLDQLRHELDQVGVSYRFVVLDPEQEYTNINLLDIDL